MDKNSSFAISNPHQIPMNVSQKLGLILGLAGVLILTLATFNIHAEPKSWFAIGSIVLIIVGATVYARSTYLKHTAGIKYNHVYFKTLSNRGVLGWAMGIVLTLFYVLL